MKTGLKYVSNILSSRRFFWIILGFFVIEAAWIAVSAIYPQAFDEDFHFGLIKVYAHYWLPFLSRQPAGADAYGAMFRDPSYLYHYAMSFPYRLIALGVHGQTNQVIIMRLFNVVLAAIGLVLFRRVLRRAGLSEALTNVSLALFVLIPIVPQVAGQINYDNLLFPLVAWICLLGIQASDELRDKRPSVRTLLTLASVGVIATLVKYELLPIFAGTVLFLIYTAYRQYRGHSRLLWSRLGESWQRQPWRTRLILGITLAVSLGLFAQRDGVNLIEYHSFVPDCGKVLNVQACSAYGPWDANYTRHQVLVVQREIGVAPHLDNPVQYIGWWVYWIWYRLFFAINGPAQYTNYPPLPLPAAASLLIGLLSIFALIMWGRRSFRSNPYLLLFTAIVVLYTATLLGEGFLQYRYTDVLVLQNGRYLLPILLLVAVIIGKPLSALFRHARKLKVLLAAAAILLFLEGGGVFTFVMRSDGQWDWPHTPAVGMNDVARKMLRPVIITGKKTYDTSFWAFN